MKDERGSASVLVVTMVGVLTLVAVAASVVVAVVRSHRVAQSAADLSALAGAQEEQRGGDGCAAAAEVAVANGAWLLTCASDPARTQVEVAVAGPRWRGHAADLRAGARAGPVDVSAGGAGTR